MKRSSFSRVCLIKPSVEAERTFAHFLCLTFVLALTSLCGCHGTPKVTIEQVPKNDLGGSDTDGVIAGHASGYRRGDRIMLFCLNSKWWVQPDVKAQLTPIAGDGSWKAHIHLGRKYAAALIRGDFAAKVSDSHLPSLGPEVLTITIVTGAPTAVDAADHSPKRLLFGGQEWTDNFHVSEYGGRDHYYLPQNAVVNNGVLHLHIKRIADQWTCSEILIGRELGYGTYKVTFKNTKGMEAAAEFSFFTMAYKAKNENYREMDFHLSRWGDPVSTNAEYVVQPYYVPANVHRFEIPAGRVSTTLKWTPGRAEVSTNYAGHPPDRWIFTANVPSASESHVYLNLCPFGYPKTPLQHDTELLVTDFEFLP